MNSALPRVCILAAGKGTRLERYSHTIHKALLPLGKKAIITRIIEKFPSSSEFVIALGHLKDQVRSYLELAHPQHKFHFIEVDNFSGPRSGPGHSLECCRSKLECPFYFVACDTLWDNANLLDIQNNWCAVSYVPASESARYCNLIIESELVSRIVDKQHLNQSNAKAFTGLCFIKDYQTFWAGIEGAALLAGERQVSAGLQSLVNNRSLTVRDIEWDDVGDSANYERALSKFEDYDFSKPDEALYIVDNKVVKYFTDGAISQKRVQRAALRNKVFPKILAEHNGFYAYAFVPGQTLYQECTAHLFNKLLIWLQQNLWQPCNVKAEELRASCRKFYFDKTLQRLAAFDAKYPELGAAVTVNKIELATFAEQRKGIEWQNICQGHAVFFHGDLQFDNILYDSSSDQFCLLDWRQDFAGTIEYGDWYYDLAKLLGGLILNYDFIKQNRFSCEEADNQICLSWASRQQMTEYISILKEFVLKQGLNWRNVTHLVPIIYLNMAPLHQPPFDRFLYFFGRLLLDERGRARYFENLQMYSQFS